MKKKLFFEFNVRIYDIANQSIYLGAHMSDDNLVRKILRSLPERFNTKVTAIKEVHDLSQKKGDELIGSLLTYEMFPKLKKKQEIDTQALYY